MPDQYEGDDSSSPGQTVASEQTPLLRSDTSSQTSRSAPSSPECQDAPAADGDEANQKVSPRRAVAIILSIYVLIFLQASNMSGMTMAQSAIAEDLDAYEYAMWFTSAYLIALSSLAPLTGRLATIFSPRSMVLVASVFFALGGVITAGAYSFSVFILGRVVTGMGGAGLMVLAFILVLELTSKKQRGLFVGMVNAGFTMGISLGAVVFGILIPVTGWRALFWIQVPAGFIAGLGVYFSIPKSFTSGQGEGGKGVSISTKLKKIDYLGAVVLTATIVCFLYGLSGKIEVTPILVSLGLLIIFVLIERFVAADPIIPIAILQDRGTLLSCFSQFGFMASRWAVLFYAPITALAVFGLSPGASGSMLIPTNIGFGAGGLLVGWLHVCRAGSFWTSCLVSIALFAVSLLTLSISSSPSISIWVYITTLFFNGLFTGATLNYTLAHMLHLTLPENHYIATSLLGTFRGFAGSFGSAIGGGIFMRTLRGSLERGFRVVDGTDQLSQGRKKLVSRLIGSPAFVYNGGLGDIDQQVAVQGYVDGLKVLFQAALVLSFMVLVIQAAAGWKGPLDKKEDTEEFREALMEHDPELEA
ncbi:major facilitator superfamily domain-containing protein [Pseudomassariella vexata]|uniref:Major facilitator superfamily domain-containing protein n=1 Tax=Pseudomassariella vexata TaxID=1141098 RepID=A0A1Y2E0M1_9PEZI|nr:major facilitator superfamily domain-containing protein [Pseudomassariella vexata]ORY65088.1 major facilitator superfamily domain-containing protein [Pseudomassariella vexata]